MLKIIREHIKLDSHSVYALIAGALMAIVLIILVTVIPARAETAEPDTIEFSESIHIISK